MAREQRQWKPFDARQLARIEQRLLEERRRILQELGHSSGLFNASSTAADGDLTNYPLHLADQGTDAIEQEKGFLLASQETRLLTEIDEALRRLYQEPEQFGRCAECGGRIALERLDAVPHARRCIRCEERGEPGARGAPASPEAPAGR